MTLDIGIERATSSNSVKMRCGCQIQNYSRIVLWGACSPEHDWILLLGTQLTAVLELIEDMRRMTERGLMR